MHFNNRKPLFLNGCQPSFGLLAKQDRPSIPQAFPKSIGIHRAGQFTVAQIALRALPAAC
jgi:hypothetical protein